MLTFRYLLLILAIVSMAACKNSTINNAAKNKVFSSIDLVNANTELLNIAMEDGFPPPIASRVYVYPHIGHYLALRSFYPDSLPDLASNLRDFGKLPNIKTDGAHPELSALLTFCKVARKVVFSEYMADDVKSKILLKAKEGGISDATIQASNAFSDLLAHEVIAWVSKDNYVETRTMDRWTSTKAPSEWRETPPDYQQGLEPHWSKIRPLVIDSASIYQATALPEYSKDKDSKFFKMVKRVYDESISLDSAKVATAWFWDDNPNTSDHTGHAVAIIHKVAPPGHWLNIISYLVKDQNSDIFKTTKAYTFSAIAMFDGIISCWYQKYKTNLVRPISYIQEYIDVNWKPLIQTPPFPEYTSGHSVISASAATILNDIYGDKTSFIDSTQMMFGLSPRKFNSFDEAAWEVSLSRYYGGIHFYNGIEEGNKQGKFIGSYVLNKIK